MSTKKKKEIPLFDLPIIETHCHLDYLKENCIDDTIADSLSQNIQKIITISVKPENLDTVIELSSNYSQVYCTQGVHPHDAKNWSPQVLRKITKNLKEHKKIVAIGEIGLDFHYNNSSKDQQLEAFEQQLQLAVKENLPVVIHSRDADEETIQLLEKYQDKMPKKGVIHSFTSGLELAKKAIGWGFHLGFNGIITFKNAENVRNALEITPVNRILLETDAPFLTPMPFRGKENAPKYLPLIAQEVAQVKSLTIEETLKMTYQNSLDLFDFEHSC